MDVPIRRVELDRATEAAATGRAREDRHDEHPFVLDPEARRERPPPREGREEREPARTPDDAEEQRIAPRTSDEVGSHLDVTA